MKPLIVITGKNGQLGWELEQLHKSYLHQFNFLFTDRNQLDLTKPETIAHFFATYQPQYFINCAAYTAVDKAETEQDVAYKVNAQSVGEIAKECAKINCSLITISTDYVFNGNGVSPYLPNHKAEPINYYGYTKWIGEKLAIENWAKTLVIRTAWVYSEHGHNFVKTILRLLKEKTEIKVVNDQIGAPTYAADLAKAIITIISEWQKGNNNFGIYHFTNNAHISWFDFANEIKSLSGSACVVLPVPSTAYPTAAKRPAYSLMDTHHIAKDFGVELTDWKQSLRVCMDKLK